MNLTDHFSLEEFIHSEKAITNNIDNSLPDFLKENALIVLNALEKVRAFYNKPISITSGYRSPDVNKLAGGSATSSHQKALAVDFHINGISNKSICLELAKGLIVPDFDQIIYEFGENGWVHLGMAEKKNKPRKMLLTAKRENGKVVYQSGIKS
jgi:zinc D-Ala-D-Ala carboxypeptidase